MSPKSLLKQAARNLLKEYSLYWVYRCDFSAPAAPMVASDAGLGPVEAPDFARAVDDEIRALRRYSGDGAYGFGAHLDDSLVAVCWYLVGDRDFQRSTWPIAEGEAKLAQITTAGRCRGQGLAPRLIAYSAAAMREQGYRTLYARIWHNNRPSIRAFERAGWKRIALVAEVTPIGARRPWRLAYDRL